MALSQELDVHLTPWEQAMLDSIAIPAELHAAVTAMHGFKHDHPTPAFLSPLILEYGLAELTPYVESQYTLVGEGPAWTRMRSSDGAVHKGLGWLGYSATIEKARPSRTYWNQLTLVFSALPSNDAPLLENIEGITRLSIASRSDLHRGVHQYDVRALEAEHSLLDHSLLDFSSGTRIRDGGAIWSFGRTHEVDGPLDQTASEALGIWVDPPTSEADQMAWTDWQTPWREADWFWQSDAVTIYRRMMLGQLLYLDWLIAFYADGAAIGFRRLRACHPVRVDAEGVYEAGGIALAIDEAGDRLYTETMTAFDEVESVTATAVALVAQPIIAADVPPGKMWLLPADVSGGVEMMRADFEIAMRPTVREQIKFIVRM